MRGVCKRVGVALGVALLALALAGCDWAMFRGGPAGTGATADQAVNVSNASSLAPAWSVPVAVPAGGVNSLVEGGGVLLLGNKAFDASTGQGKWTSELIEPGNVAIGNGLVYGTGTTGPTESPEVRALDAATGVLRWRLVSASPSGAPIVDGGLLYQPNSSGRGGGSSVAAIDAKAGTYRFSVGGSIGAESPPTSANNTSYNVGLSMGNGFRLTAVDAGTGVQKWDVDAAPCSFQPLSVPAVANGKVYSSGQTFDAASGARLWPWPVCQAGTTIAVTSTTVYVPYFTKAFGLLLGAFDAGTGAMRWAIPWSTNDPAESSAEPSAPVVANGVLFGVAPNDGMMGNHVIADDARTGARLWNSPRKADNSYGDPIVANGLVYAASADGHLDAFAVPGG